MVSCCCECSTKAARDSRVIPVRPFFQERETGIEPAMSNLGKSNAIEYKEHRVHGGLSEFTEIPGISRFQKSDVLTRQNCGRTTVVRFEGRP